MAQQGLVWPQRYLLYHPSLHIGAFTSVWRARDRFKHVDVAIKQLQLSNMKKEQRAMLHAYLRSGLLNYRKLTSPRIARLLDAFIWVNEDGFAYLCVVMELADGPNLWDHVRHAFSAGLPEDTARWYFQQLILALDYMHRRGVYHRDLKLEHLLLCGNLPGVHHQLKVCSFSFSKHSNRNRTGTNYQESSYHYAAPEMLLAAAGVQPANDYLGPEIDMWYAGVCLFLLLNPDSPPFNHPLHQTTAQDALQQRENAIHPHNNPRFQELSEPCKALLNGLLSPTAAARLTIPDVRNSEWFQQQYAPGFVAGPAAQAMLDAAFQDNVAICELTEQQIINLVVQALAYV